VVFSLNKRARENPLFNVTELKSSESLVEQAESFDIDGNIILNENFPSRRIIRGEKVLEYRIVSKNNKGIDYKEVSGTPIYDSEGNEVNAVAKADILAKLIEVVEGKRGIDTLPEEAGHMLVRMLGSEHPLVQTMMKNVDKYQVYQDVISNESYQIAFTS